MQVDDYHIPKLIAEECILIRSTPSNRHLLYNKFSILTPEYVQRGVNGEEGGVNGEEGGSGVFSDNGCFAFTRFMDLSPMELYKIMLCGWLFA